MNNDNLNKKLNIAHIVVSFIMAGVLYVLILGVCGIAPFGDNTYLAYDMKRQYVDYYAYYRTILSGENNIFYSFSTALGSGLIGFFTYYLTSPFLILTILFPVDKMPLAVTLIIGLKLASASATCDMMLQKICGKSTYICTMAYAFCAYMMSNAMNMMWLDVIIMLPIVLIMTEKLLHENKLFGYTVSIALILYLNYYISYMVLIFVALWSLVRLWTVRSKEPQEAILRLGLATGAGIGIDAFFLLPTFLELRNSPKEVSLGAIALEGRDLYPGQLFVKFMNLSFDSKEVYWGGPQLFCGLLILMLGLSFYFNKKIGIREKVSMGIMMLVMLVSFTFDSINILWHAAMEPSGYPYRQAFIFVLLLVICACRSLSEPDGITAGGTVSVAVLTAVIMIFAFTSGEEYIDTRFVIINTAEAAAGYILFVLIMHSRKRAICLLAGLAAIIFVTGELGLNGVYIYRIESLQGESASGFADTIDTKKAAVSGIKAMDSTFCRMDDLSPRQQNDSMMHDYRGVTHYSSAGLTYVRSFLQRLGYNDDSLYTDYGHDNTETADSILGVRYLISDGQYDMHKDYELVSEGREDIYRNPYALPVGIGVYREMSGEAMDPFSLQEDMYGRLVGEPVDIFIPADVQLIESDNSRPVRQYSVITQADGELYFYMSDLIGTHSNLEIFYNGEFYSYYGNDSCLKVLNLGYYHKGDYMMIDVIANDSGEFGEGLFMTEDTAALADAYNRTLSRHAAVERISASRLAMTLDSAYTVGDGMSGNVGVFTTIPYQKGWKVKVAGVRVEPTEVYDSLMYIPVTEALQIKELEPNEDVRIELEFVPEGFTVGVIVSVLTLAVIILMASIRRGEASFFGEDEDESDDSYFPLEGSDGQDILSHDSGVTGITPGDADSMSQ